MGVVIGILLILFLIALIIFNTLSFTSGFSRFNKRMEKNKVPQRKRRLINFLNIFSTLIIIAVLILLPRFNLNYGGLYGRGYNEIMTFMIYLPILMWLYNKIDPKMFLWNKKGKKIKKISKTQKLISKIIGWVIFLAGIGMAINLIVRNIKL